MSSKERPQKGLIEAATELGDQVYRQVYERFSGRAGADTADRAAGVVDAANERASGAVDLARDIAGLILRTAITIAEDVVEAAGQLESVVAGQPVGSPIVEPHESDDAVVTTAAPVALGLPDVSPGRTTSIPFDVRNDSLETIDAMRLRCGGLFGPGDVRIAGHYIKFAPVTVDVASHSVAKVTCTVDVPADAKRGHYAGLIEATGLTGVQLLVSLDVK